MNTIESKQPEFNQDDEVWVLTVRPEPRVYKGRIVSSYTSDVFGVRYFVAELPVPSSRLWVGEEDVFATEIQAANKLFEVSAKMAGELREKARRLREKADEAANKLTGQAYKYELDASNILWAAKTRGQ
jgi:hypothetical protein